MSAWSWREALECILCVSVSPTGYKGVGLLCFFLHQSLVNSDNRLTGIFQKEQVASADGEKFSELQVNTIRPKFTQKPGKQPIKIANGTGVSHFGMSINHVHSRREVEILSALGSSPSAMTLAVPKTQIKHTFLTLTLKTSHSWNNA